MRRQYQSVIMTAALTMLLCQTAAAAGKPRLLTHEAALEVVPSQVILPSSATGTLVVTPCVGCTPLSFTSSERTVWQIGADKVSLVALRNHLNQERRAQLVVLFDSKARSLRALVASAK
jgi:hypothetical protein